MIPEWRESKGSSDGFIQSKKYRNMIEIRISDMVDFAYVLDKEGKVYHLFFFDKNSAILYNKSIENQTLKVSLQKTVILLQDKGYLKEGDSITIIRYGDEFYSDFMKTWRESIPSYEIIEEEATLQERAMSLGIEEEKTSSILLNLDFYSKEFTRNLPEEKSMEEILNERG